VLKQPDLGTAILLIAGGGIVMFCAGVSWWYFIAVVAARTAVSRDELVRLGYAPVALPPELAEKSQARGLIVMRK